ncbi:MAG: SDR family oxidoreductase [Candidatus Latescibacteria bacterium]|jgi:short-subunit dehydrogenase|nr:SDR family oxidoreductase [Candidatus Latescibacterota bacterium]
MFRDKVAIITGASSGLGAVLAVALAKEGVHLSLFARREEKLSETAEHCRGLGVRVITVTGDVTFVEDCKRLIETTMAEFGRLDFLIANAGISMWARFDEVEDVGIFHKLMETNYLGVVHCVHSALEPLKQSQGLVVAIASVQGKIGVPLHTGYVASKHAVLGFLKALRMEVADVHVLTVLPHWLRGTDLRQSAFGKDGETLGESSRRHNKESISLEDCSQAILKAMQKRKSELVIPWKLRILPWLQLINPKIVEWLVKGKVKEQNNN